MIYKNKIGILIPTMNRPEMIERALNYYSRARFDGTIYFGDSSTHCKNSVVEVLTKYSKRQSFKIKYFYLDPEEYTSATTFKYLVDNSEEPFLCYSGDDDIQMPDSLAKCVQFLETNPGFSGCHGFRLEFQLDIQKNIILKCNKPFDPDLDLDDPVHRLLNFYENSLSPQYYVLRRRVFENAYASVQKVKTRFFLEEILPCSIICLSGKIKKLDMPQTLFQVYDSNNDPRTLSFNRTSIFDLIVSDDFKKSFDIMFQALKNEMALYCDEIEIKKMVFYLIKLISDHHGGVMFAHITANRQKPFNKTWISRMPFITSDCSIRSVIRRIFLVLKQMFKVKHDDTNNMNLIRDALLKEGCKKTAITI